MELALEILKWVALVFVAGVIGQLGKSLTLRIIDSRRRRREGKNAETKMVESPAAAPSRNDAAMGKEERKARKKEAKSDLKRRKKEEPG